MLKTVNTQEGPLTAEQEKHFTLSFYGLKRKAVYLEGRKGCLNVYGVPINSDCMCGDEFPVPFLKSGKKKTT